MSDLSGREKPKMVNDVATVRLFFLLRWAAQEKPGACPAVRNTNWKPNSSASADGHVRLDTGTAPDSSPSRTAIQSGQLKSP
jgi:hypothetical protein